MKSRMSKALAAAVVSLSIVGGAAIAAAQGDDLASRTELSVMGGLQALNENDTALPDGFVNIPAVATLTYHLTPLLAAEGEFTWLIPVQQSVKTATGVSQDLKTPNILAYQANLRAGRSVGAWAPYLAAGVGAMTFLSNTDANRLPQLAESQTAFAINFGTGLTYALAPRWGVRADFREFAAFPPKDAAGLSTAGKADPIWMERGAVGLALRF